MQKKAKKSMVRADSKFLARR